MRLDGVAQRGSGAVCLHGVHFGGGQPGGGQGLADDPLLGGAAGGRQTVRRAVLVDGGAADDGEHAVSVAPGVGEAFQEQEARALGPAGAVGLLGEGLAAAVGGQTALLAERDERRGRGHHHGAAREGERAFLAAQGLRGEVGGDQGGGAGGVDTEGGALEAERVGQPAREHGGRSAGAEVSVHDVGDGVRVEVVVVVLAAGADEDADVASAQRVGGEARAFEGLPGQFEQDPLLRVGGQGLAR